MNKDKMDRARSAAAAVLDVPVEIVEVRVRGKGRGGGRPRKVSDEAIRVALVAAGGNQRAAAAALGISEGSLRDRLKPRRKPT